MTIRAAAAVLLAAALCGATEKAMTIQEWKGTSGGPSAPGHEAALDAKSWDSVWRKLSRPAPTLDFDRFVAVAVYVGERATGGFTAVFDEPVMKGDDLIVRYRIPKPAGFVSQAFTHPWKVRVFPRPKGRVHIEVLP
jgi:hypothetical protein